VWRGRAERREVYINDLLRNLLRTGTYDARCRVLLREFALLLDVSHLELQRMEMALADQLQAFQHAHKEEVWPGALASARRFLCCAAPPSPCLGTVQIEKEMAERSRQQKQSRWLMIGTAGLLVGLCSAIPILLPLPKGRHLPPPQTFCLF
jgi:hypothetical protein